MQNLFCTMNTQGRELHIGACVDIPQVLLWFSFQTLLNQFLIWLDPWNDGSLNFDSSLCALDLHIGSEGCENARSCGIILSWHEVAQTF